ncbi:peptidase M4 family protein [Jiella sp. 40Bstr34]|uniref:Neutral metalloproteinase n=2 Tax=Jiella pacifica TaxID=2696469 RepID=A0A6N9T2N6_9HYPH|nr:peptidase M4 family protein [Jiella pacifica]
MLRVLSIRAGGEVAKMARSLLDQSEKFRESRSEDAGTVMVPGKALPGAFVAAAMSAPAGLHDLHREIYDGENKAALPGKPVRSEGSPATGDAAVDAAYDNAKIVFDLYSDEFNRNSLDGKGLPLKATVHHRRDFNNAFWNGSQMVYGDGDGVIFRNFLELSVVAHEMSHGVVGFSGGLTYQGQSGALNESFADVFGALAVQRNIGQSAHEADWLIGKGILGPGINGAALRSMRAPGTAYSDGQLGQDPQPYHMDLFVNTSEDNGGVHINSGIPNHAFYLFSVLLGGNAWGAPGHIWYAALQSLNNPFASFADWAAETMEAATGLYGVRSLEFVFLRRAWKLVGISV